LDVLAGWKYSGNSFPLYFHPIQIAAVQEEINRKYVSASFPPPKTHIANRDNIMPGKPHQSVLVPRSNAPAGASARTMPFPSGIENSTLSPYDGMAKLSVANVTLGTATDAPCAVAALVMRNVRRMIAGRVACLMKNSFTLTMCESATPEVLGFFLWLPYPDCSWRDNRHAKSNVIQLIRAQNLSQQIDDRRNPLLVRTQQKNSRMFSRRMDTQIRETFVGCDEESVFLLNRFQRMGSFRPPICWSMTLTAS
jgi:hypothetical protein